MLLLPSTQSSIFIPSNRSSFRRRYFCKFYLEQRHLHQYRSWRSGCCKPYISQRQCSWKSPNKFNSSNSSHGSTLQYLHPQPQYHPRFISNSGPRKSQPSQQRWPKIRENPLITFLTILSVEIALWAIVLTLKSNQLAEIAIERGKTFRSNCRMWQMNGQHWRLVEGAGCIMLRLWGIEFYWWGFLSRLR